LNRRAAAFAALLCLAAACGGDDSPPPATFAGSPLGSDARHFRDQQGRSVILRGVNARVRTVFDVAFDDGRVAVEEIPELTTADCQRMAELGFNFLRLPISWSAVEPRRGEYSEPYLLAVDAAVECAAGAGLYVLIDFHQDAFSKEIGEDGAPLWAILPAPTQLLEGPLMDLTERRLSLQVSKAFDSFFAAGDPDGLQKSFIDALAHVAAHYADAPGVAGFEIFNEPPMDPDRLYPFTYAAAERLRAVAPKKLIFFEPPVTRNQTDQAALATAPFPVAGAIYSPHVYTSVGDSFGIEELEPSVENARGEAESWKTPLFIGEFGHNPDAHGQKFVGLQFDLQDKYLASSALWLWKEHVQGSWGFFDYDQASSTFSERPLVVATASRPWAQRIAGTPTQMQWDPAAGRLTVAYEQAVDAPNVIAVPAPYQIVSVTCDGKEVTPSGQAPRFEATCSGAGAHTLIVKLSQ